MKPPLYLSVVVFFSAVTFIVQAEGDHKHGPGCNHDHSAKEPESANLFAVSENAQNDLGLEVAVVEMRTVAGDVNQVIAIPRESVVTENGKTFVFAQAEGNNTKFERWEVQLGAGDDEFIEAVSGVFPGDALVTKGAQFMPALEGADSLAFEQAAPVEEAPVEKAPVKSDTLEDSETAQSASEMVQSARSLCPLENTRCELQLQKDTRCDRGGDCPNLAAPRPACTINRYGYEAVETSCSQERDIRIVYVPGYGYVKAITYPY